MNHFKLIRLFFWTLVVFGLSACSDDSTAGRGIWDETENGLAVVVHDKIGTPVVGARVKLVSSTATVEKEMISDSTGTAYFESPLYSGHAEVSSQMGVARAAFAKGDSTVSEVVTAPATFKGSVDVSTGSVPESLYLLGTSYKAIVAADGSFAFDSVPPGDYAVLSSERAGYAFWNSVSLEANKTEKRVLEAPSRDSVVVDDFEDGYGQNLFYSITGSSWWFVSSDSFSVVTPSIPQKALVHNPDSCFMGRGCIHEVFTIDTNATSAFAMCGFDIGISHTIDSNGYDMTKADSITFMVRGSGSIIVQFLGYTATGKALSWEFKFRIPSETEWNHVVVRPQGNESWEAIKAQMKTINFLVTSSTDLWLDQITFHGLSANDLFSKELAK